jgi:hypothetical protein
VCKEELLLYPFFEYVKTQKMEKAVKIGPLNKVDWYSKLMAYLVSSLEYKGN